MKIRNVVVTLSYIAVGAILYFSGILSQASSLAQRAVLLSGFADAPAVTDENKEPFDYNFVVKDLQGNKTDFGHFKGKVVFLNLWATWCPPCRSEMPGIQKLYDRVDKDKIEFVMLSLDKDGQVERVKNYVNKSAYTFPIYMPSGYLSAQLQVPSIPTTFVISADGHIVFKEVGMKNYDTEKFKKFLNQFIVK